MEGLVLCHVKETRALIELGNLRDPFRVSCEHLITNAIELVFPGKESVMSHIPNRNVAADAAAKLVLKGINSVLADPRSSAKALSEAIIPLLGLRWNREVCERVGSSTINQMLYRLRNSLLPPETYRGIKELFFRSH